ncbi:MAG: ATP-binding domain-containing protein, partial [Nostoc sp.]
AWSLTIHQSQGSEYPVVILPIYTEPYMMLSRQYCSQKKSIKRGLM